MSDEPQLQVTRKDENSSLSLSTVRSGLIARGRRDAEAIARQAAEPIDPLSETRQRAEAGDADAQRFLGRHYCDAEDYVEGLKWRRKAADAGNQRAAEEVGFLYYDGYKGVPQDYAEAVKWFRKGARSLFGWGELCLGKCYFYGLGVEQDYAEATRWLLEALQTEAEPIDEIGYLLSRVYSLGDTVKQWRGTGDVEDGWELYAEDAKRSREHAEGGSEFHPIYPFRLGLAYAYGRGVPQDHTEAAKWFRRAADAGEAWAQLHLAMTYTLGRGVTQDYIQAHMWFNIVASRTDGDPEFVVGPFPHTRPSRYASDAGGAVAAKMTHDQIAEAQRLAREWRPTSEDEG